MFVCIFLVDLSMFCLYFFNRLEFDMFCSFSFWLF